MFVSRAFLTKTCVRKSTYWHHAKKAAGVSVILVAVLLSAAIAAAGEKPAIIQPPQDQLVLLAGTGTFTVTPGGDGPFTFGWRLNGTNLHDTDLRYAGVLTPNLQVLRVGAEDVGDYSVVVTNAFGVVTSQVARLDIPTVFCSVTHAGTTDPRNEGWRDLGTAIAISVSPTNDNGTSAWAVNDPSDELSSVLMYACFPTTNLTSMAHAHGWSLRSTLRLLGNNAGGYANTIMLGFNTGDWYHRLDLNTDSSGNPTVEALGGGMVTLAGTGYHTYELRYLPGDAPRLYVDGELKLTGCQGQALTMAPRLFFGAGRSAGVGLAHFASVEFQLFGPPHLVQLALSRTNAVGDNVAFSVTATSHRPLTYQWYQGNVPLSDNPQITGATSNLLSLAHLSLNAAGAYSVRVSDGQFFTNSPPMNLVVYPAAESSLLAPEAGAGFFRFSVAGPPGLRYAVQSSTDLTTWAWLQTNHAPFQYSATPAVTSPHQFYRAVYLP